MKLSNIESLQANNSTWNLINNKQSVKKQKGDDRQRFYSVSKEVSNPGPGPAELKPIESQRSKQRLTNYGRDGQESWDLISAFFENPEKLNLQLNLIFDAITYIY